MEFAQSLKQMMESKSITMYRLAKELGVHQTTIKNWLDGKGEPSVSQFRRIALIMGVEEVDFMLTAEEKKRYISSYIDWVREHPEEVQEMANKYPHPPSTPEQNRRFRILAYYDHVLSEEGQQKAVERVEELTEIPRYRRQDTPPSPTPIPDTHGTLPPPESPENGG